MRREIECKEFHTSNVHPLVRERRRADYFQELYEMMLKCTFVVTIAAGMAVGVLLALASAAGFFPV